MIDMNKILDDAFKKVVGKPFQHERDAQPITTTKRTRKQQPKLTRNLQIGERRWKDAVATKLRDGYGVEDIAIWMDCHLCHIQDEVARLRIDGVFEKWWGKQ
jgi:hypothetical protein